MEEYIDILNENGELTGKTATKKEVHERGLWYQAVHIWIVNSNGELLIQLRGKNKKAKPNMWDISVAGHVSAGETPFQSALREIKEELGIDIQEEKLSSFGKVIQQAVLNNGTYRINQFNTLYIIEKDIPLSEMKMQESEVQDLRYVPWRELQRWVENGGENSAGEKLVPHPEEYRLLFQYLENKYN